MPRVKKSVVYPLIGFLAASAFFGALLYVFAWGFRPDVSTPLPKPDPAYLAGVEDARKTTLHKANPPRIQRQVDYTQGSQALWWPKGESPILAELVIRL